MTQTYVYKGKEVFLTGRKAIKESRRGRRVKEVFEILPVKYRTIKVDAYVSSEWVSMGELYEIRDDE